MDAAVKGERISKIATFCTGAVEMQGSRFPVDCTGSGVANFQEGLSLLINRKILRGVGRDPGYV